MSVVLRSAVGIHDRVTGYEPVGGRCRDRVAHGWDARAAAIRVRLRRLWNDDYSSGLVDVPGSLRSVAGQYWRRSAAVGGADTVAHGSLGESSILTGWGWETPSKGDWVNPGTSVPSPVREPIRGLLRADSPCIADCDEPRLRLLVESEKPLPPISADQAICHVVNGMQPAVVAKRVRTWVKPAVIVA